MSTIACAPAWARAVAKGLGFYSRLVTVLKVGLPLLALCLLSALFFFTLRDDRESELVFSSSDLEVSSEGLQVTRPTLSGRTRDGDAFRFVAESAVPDGAPPTRVAIRGLDGDLSFKGGQRVEVSAGSADLDLESDAMELRQEVTVASSDGYRISAERMRLELRPGTIDAEGTVHAVGPMGEIWSETLQIVPSQSDPDRRVISFGSGVRLLYLPGREDDQ
jgi:lipopolysaccharide export system protein LptC